MNTAIIQHAQGICFAVPVNIVNWVVASLISRGRVFRGYLGISGQTVSLAGPPASGGLDAGNSPRESGVVIVGVVGGGPADRAGLRPGDILIQLGDQPMVTVDHIHRLLSEESVGAELRFAALRQGQRLEGWITPTDSSPAL